MCSFPLSVLNLLCQLLNQQIDFFCLESEAGWICHQTCTDGANRLQHGQAVFFEGFPGLHDIDNHIGKAEDRGQLDGAVELDELHITGLAA